MINLCNTLLPHDKVHAIPADIGKTIKRIPITDRVEEVDVASMITILSTNSNFFSKLCSKSLFSKGARGYNLSHFCSLHMI